MSIDLARFHAIFFAESLEQLDAMEAELLRPDVEAADAESINTIFRAAHSIKGTSATFEFDDIAGLTHVLETLLDQVRSGDRVMDQPLVDLLLESVDCLRELLLGYQSGTPAPSDTAENLRGRVAALIGDDTSTADAQDTESGMPGSWRIAFTPHAHLMKTGNDPYRILRELSDLGDLTVSADLSRLPSLKEMDPESIYLSWDMTLDSKAARNEIDELFEWVEGDCELNIESNDRLMSDANLELEASDLHVSDGKLDLESEHKPTPPPPPTSRDFTAPSLGRSIRVDTDKIDQLINLVGELIITESMIKRLVGTDVEDEFDPVQDTLQQLSRNVRNLQETALNMRMLPVSFSLTRLPRIVRELGKELGKDAMLEMSGEQTEVDKTVLEKISDPLIHLVRNAIDHGIEPVRERLSAGKPSRATVRIRVYHQGGNVFIKVSDDGRGLDQEKILAKARQRGLIADDAELDAHRIQDLIFSPGFSTAGEVTDISGRGVGLDVVRKNIQELGGYVSVESKAGAGSEFTITLPLTLAIIDGQLVRIGANLYVVPLLSIIENSLLDEERFESVGGHRGMYRFRDSVVPVLDLGEMWQIEGAEGEAPEQIIMVESGGQTIGLLVHELLDQQQVVIKSLEKHFRAVAGISGATILGDGTVALILDIPGLVKAIASEERQRERRRKLARQRKRSESPSD